MLLFSFYRNNLCFCSVARGVGELDLNQPEKHAIQVDERNPYLLLDVRDADDYEMCHIISGRLAPFHSNCSSMPTYLSLFLYIYA